MVLRVFQRSVHPELLETVSESRMQVGDCSVTARICRDGHAIEFRHGNKSITEAAVSRQLELPEFGRIIDRRLIGYHTHELKFGQLQYFCSYQLEQVSPEIYLDLHREMQMDARQCQLSAEFRGASENGPGCLSLMHCDPLRNGVVIHAYHTFPENAAILRIQSLFEWQGAV